MSGKFDLKYYQYLTVRSSHLLLCSLQTTTTTTMAIATTGVAMQMTTLMTTVAMVMMITTNSHMEAVVMAVDQDQEGVDVEARLHPL